MDAHGAIYDHSIDGVGESEEIVRNERYMKIVLK